MIAHVTDLVIDARYILLCTVAWFALACAVGHATARGAAAVLRQESSQSDVSGLGPLLHPEIKYRKAEIQDARLLRATVGLFVRNALGLGAVLYLGSMLIFVPPLLVFAQGWLVGAVLEQGGYQDLLHRTLPHGVIELPVTLAVCSVAMLLASRLYRTFKGNVAQGVLSTLREASKTYAACVPLVIICAALEGYGTRILWGSP